MTSKRRGWRRKGIERKLHGWEASRGECGKFAYTSRKAARAAARKHNDPGLREYVCSACSLWHVGHLPQSVKAGDITADEIYRRRADLDEPAA